MNKDLYGYIELEIKAESNFESGNSANYKKLANWNNSRKGNVSSIGLNGNSSYYGLNDMCGQLYQWTDTNGKIQGTKKIKGGSYLDENAYYISKNNDRNFDIDLMTNDGQFGFRLATYSNPTTVLPLGSLQSNTFLHIQNTNNPSDSNISCTTIGSVNYAYYIMENFVTNNIYVQYLNIIDPTGNNINEIYDNRMFSSPVGGIVFDKCKSNGSKYYVKPGMGNKPVAFITWTMAAKYTNWISSTGSSMYYGVYDINQPTDIDFLVDDFCQTCGSGLILNDWYCCNGESAALASGLCNQDEKSIVHYKNYKIKTNDTALIINQIPSSKNGIYYLSEDNIFYRSPLYPSGSPVYAGSLYYIQYGANKSELYLLNNDNSTFINGSGLYGTRIGYVGQSDLIFTKSNGLNRATSAVNYFLPSENEWYKAAYYDPNKNGTGSPGYWKYGNRSDTEPLAVIVDVSGNYKQIEQYVDDTKTFPLMISLNNNELSSINSDIIKYSQYSGEYISNPTILSIESDISGTGEYVSSIVTNISGLKYNQKYNYEYSAYGGNWPCSIFPVTGSFVHKDPDSSVNNITSILKFKPQDIYDEGSSFSNLYHHTNTGILKNAIPEELYTNLAITLSSNYSDNISASQIISKSRESLPVSKSRDTSSINFKPYTSELTIANNVCDEYIPLVMDVNNPTVGKSYSFKLSSDKSNVIFMPDSGLVSFGNGSNPNRITSLFNLYDNSRAIVKVELSRLDIDYSTLDFISVKCLNYCDSIYNHANYNGTAIWGWCSYSGEDGCNIVKQNTYPNVTTVGTNGGPSAYGTYDQDGNILEICSLTGSMGSNNYVYRGGSFNSTIIGKAARFTFNTDTMSSSYSGVADFIGFRVVCTESGLVQNITNTIDLVPVEHIGIVPTGNIPDDTGYGSVNYPYMISTYPIKNNLYAEYLNETAQTNNASRYLYSPLMSGCFGGIDRSGVSPAYSYHVQTDMEEKPVRFVSRNMSCRFVNWLHNKAIGSSEVGYNLTISGVYSFSDTLGSDILLNNGDKSDCSKYYIPSENEWYKAAYYNGPNQGNWANAIYWDYATQSTTQPASVIANSVGDGVV